MLTETRVEVEVRGVPDAQGRTRGRSCWPPPACPPLTGTQGIQRRWDVS